MRESYKVDLANRYGLVLYADGGNVLVERIASFVELRNLVAWLCLVTQCKRGSTAPPRRNASLVCELRRQEPPLQCVPRQSLGTSSLLCNVNSNQWH